MQDVHETLLHIAYSLHNQNQIITVEAIRQPLGWLQIQPFDLENEIIWLIENGFFCRNSNNELFLTETGKIESVKINKVRTKTDFNRMIKCATDSRAYLDYCEGIYGYRMYIFYSQYIFDEANKDKVVLHHDNTRIAGSLQKNELKYRVVDYSANESALYENALIILPKYKNSLTQEGNRELFETKMRENKSGKELYDKGLARRYLYIVE